MREIPLTITNTLTNKREELVPQEEGLIRFYSCGPTTYDYLHVGNARALIVSDLMYRGMMALGYKVLFVRNFTDVDDKIIQRAKEQNMPPLALSQKYLDEALIDMANLNLMQSNHHPKVSDSINEIIELINTLLDKNFAYAVNNEVYFDTASYIEYGKLSKLKLDQLDHGHRVEQSANKKNPTDFVLWKPIKDPAEVSWESPWGKGRPGWHIECSAMAKKYMGDTIDLHHGGIDLIFPHHENELAQSNCGNGAHFCDYWVHHEFVNFGDDKMSKSLGNVVTIREFNKIWDGIILRHIFLMIHYKSKIVWSEEIIEQAYNEVIRLNEFYAQWISYDTLIPSTSQQDKHWIAKIKVLKEEMCQDVALDFNIPKVMALFFVFIKDIRRDVLIPEKSLDLKEKHAIKSFIDLFMLITGHFQEDPTKLLDRLNEKKKQSIQGGIDNQWVEEQVQLRKKYKIQKDWKKSDEIRDLLKTKGIILTDSATGETTWKVGH